MRLGRKSQEAAPSWAQLCQGLGEARLGGELWVPVGPGSRVTLAPGSQHAGSPARPGHPPTRPPASPPPASAAPTQAPSWPWFSPCFSNYVEWAKNSSSGALFGSRHHRPRSLPLPSLQLAPRAALRGTCPCCLDFCPHAFLLTGASGLCAPCTGPDRPGQVARGGVQAARLRRPGWPGSAGAGSRAPTQAFPDEATVSGRLGLCDLRVCLPHLAKK